MGGVGGRSSRGAKGSFKFEGVGTGNLEGNKPGTNGSKRTFGRPHGEGRDRDPRLRTSRESGGWGVRVPCPQCAQKPKRIKGRKKKRRIDGSGRGGHGEAVQKWNIEDKTERSKSTREASEAKGQKKFI